MTIETQVENKRKFRMLIGDDAFVDPHNSRDAMFIMLCEMAKATGEKLVEGRFVDSTNSNYECTNFPIPGFYEAEIKVVSSVQEMIAQSRGNYDWIVTDMNYGPGHREGGFEVLRNISQNPVIKAIFTSEDNPNLLEQLTKCGADKIISPNLTGSSEDKVVILGRVIAEHYQNSKQKSE